MGKETPLVYLSFISSRNFESQEYDTVCRWTGPDIGYSDTKPKIPYHLKTSRYLIEKTIFWKFFIRRDGL